jgi:hypothetical protein
VVGALLVGLALEQERRREKREQKLDEKTEPSR